MSRRGFTLVEILMVVVMLGVVAAIVVPRVSLVSDTARANGLRSDLSSIRRQIQVYTFQHNLAPGYPAQDPEALPNAEAFCSQMAPLIEQVPANPVNGSRDVLVLADGEQMPDWPVEGYGWIYHPASRTFKANCAGTDENGRAFFDY